MYMLATWGFMINDWGQSLFGLVYRHVSFRRGDWEACLHMEIPSAEESAVIGVNIEMSFRGLERMVVKTKTTKHDRHSHRE